MSKVTAPPDQLQRDLALDPAHSILVQAPAGSGKTTLLTERFLALLAEVDDPGQVVAITFTNAAAAEMRNRVLDELRKTEPSPLALRALARSNALGWKLLDLPAQLRISTIMDSAGNWRSSSRCSLASVAASTSPSSRRISTVAPPVSHSRQSAVPAIRRSLPPLRLCFPGVTTTGRRSKTSSSPC